MKEKLQNMMLMSVDFPVRVATMHIYTFTFSTGLILTVCVNNTALM